MEDVLTKCLQPTNMMIKNLIEIEMGYVNVNHPDFLGATGALLNLSNENSQENNIQSDLEQALKQDTNSKNNQNKKAGTNNNRVGSSDINAISNNVNSVNNNLNSSMLNNGATFWEKINPFGKSQQNENQDQMNKSEKSFTSESKPNY